MSSNNTQCISSKNRESMRVLHFILKGVREMGASALHKKQGVLRKNEGLISLWHYLYKDDRGLLDTSKQKQNQILI